MVVVPKRSAHREKGREGGPLRVWKTVRRYRVVATPTTIIIDPKGNVLERVEVGIGKMDFLTRRLSTKD